MGSAAAGLGSEAVAMAVEEDGSDREAVATATEEEGMVL